MKQYLVPIFITSVTLFTSCKDKKGPAQIVPDVNVVTATQRTVPVFAEYVGQTFGQSDIEVRSRVEGWVQGIHFKEGATVTKGQLLYVVQDDELRDKEQAAQAQLAQANVMLVKASSDLDRVRPLAAMNALSMRDLDAAQATYDAQVAAVKAAKAALNNARTQLSYTRIMAPISGTIGISTVQPGDYVKSLGQSPLTTISAVGAMRVRFAITENDYLKYSQQIGKDALRNLEVQFILNDGSVFPETGRLDFANREIDPATGSLTVQAVVDNKSHLLRPGQYVKVRFKSAEMQDAILVPQQAINQMQNVYMAFVVNDSNKINPRPVITGPRVGSNWVITSGLKAGERVALVGNAIVKPGMVIKPVMVENAYDSTSVK